MNAIVRRDDDGLTQSQIDLVKDTFARGSTNEELGLFVQTCNRLRLDPFARQIFLVKRWDSQLRREVAQSQVSIDGFRLIAERSGQYRGQTPPQWCGQDGVWHDVWLRDEPPAAGRCGVIREGFAEPLYRVARFKSYAQTTKEGALNRMWRTMPDVMIAKCAEALALRAAFPNELSGVYADAEMEQADFAVEHEPREERPRPAVKRLAPQTELIDEHGEVHNAPSPAVARDEYGLAIPTSPCPVVRPGKPNAGKRWDELNGPVVEKMYDEAGDKMTEPQRTWCEYLMAKRQARKAVEARESEAAAAAKAQDAAAEAPQDGGGWVAGDEPAAAPEGGPT